jgi:hypothetical protein
LVRAAARGALCLTLSGCMSLAPQLEPTDFARIDQAKDRKDRDQLFHDNTIYRHEEPQGTRYTKGNVDGTTKRSWQSLDAVLRSDANSSAALPAKQLRRSRVFTGLTLASSVLFIAGGAATARDGFSFKEPSAANLTLIGGALLSVAFAVVAGVLYRRASKGYDRAVDVYNDSLGVRLGVMTPQGQYIPPAGVEVVDGYIMTEDKLPPGVEGPPPMTAPLPAAPPAAPSSTAAPPASPAAPAGASPPPASAAPPSAAPPSATAAPVVPAPPRHSLRAAPSSAPASPKVPLDPGSPLGALTLLPAR